MLEIINKNNIFHIFHFPSMHLNFSSFLYISHILSKEIYRAPVAYRFPAITNDPITPCHKCRKRCFHPAKSINSKTQCQNSITCSSFPNFIPEQMTLYLDQISKRFHQTFPLFNYSFEIFHY